MSPSAIALLLRMELRAILRDGRVLFFSFALPFLLAPALLLVGKSVKTADQQRAAQRVASVAVAGARADEARRLVERATKRDPSIAIAIKDAPAEGPGAALDRGDIDAYIELLDPDEAKNRDEGLADVDKSPKAARAATERREAQSDDPASARLPVLVLSYRQDRTASQRAEEAIRRVLAQDRRERRVEALAAKGMPGPPGGPRAEWLTARDVATAEELSGSRAGSYITAIILLLMLVGGASIASDSIAGEKERGTLETLLSSGVARSDLVASKLLLIFLATLFTTVIQLVNLSVCAALGLLDEAAGPILLAPLRAAPLLALLFLPVSALVASVLVLLFGMARSYKEAQLYFSPLTLAGPAIALAPTLPGLELRSAAAAVPLVSVSLAVKDVLLGKYDWPMIALAWLSTAGAALLVARAAGKALSAERLIAPSEGEDPKDGQARLGAKVLSWFAALWAFTFVLSASGSGLSFQTGMLVGQGFFVVFSAVLLRMYRLDIRDALSLRRPKPIVWPAVVLGVPSALIVTQDLYRLVSRFIPVPEKALEQLADKLLPAGIPAWQLVFFFALLPGVCEEILFRGVLLHGLRRRLRPVALCIVVGAIFGLFHLALFRLATTAFLGALLTAVTLVTGSIFPSMLWHVLNNASALLTMKANLPVDSLPPWAHGAAILALCLSFFLLWKGRASPNTSGPQSKNARSNEG